GRAAQAANADPDQAGRAKDQAEGAGEAGGPHRGRPGPARGLLPQDPAVQPGTDPNDHPGHAWSAQEGVDRPQRQLPRGVDQPRSETVRPADPPGRQGWAVGNRAEDPAEAHRPDPPGHGAAAAAPGTAAQGTTRQGAGGH